MGQEAEYALRFTPRGAAKRPSHRQVHELLVRALSRQVATTRGRRWHLNLETFVENGGSFNYEALPGAPADGLIEGSTPECRGAAQTLLYQRAQEKLLQRSLPLVERELEALGYPGRLALLKNGRDAEGHVYGVQESYEAEVAEGAALWSGRALLLALIPPTLLLSIVIWCLDVAVVLAVILAYLVVMIAGLLVPPLRPWAAELLDTEPRNEHRLRWPAQVTNWVGQLVMLPVSLPLTVFMARFWFRGLRAASLAHFASRCIFAGAGSLDEHGRFALSERGPSIGGEVRWLPMRPRRVVFDQLNLLKPLYALRFGDFSGYLALLGRAQRLQIGYAEANRADVAELLRLGTTALVLDMAEAGLLDDAPRLAHPAVAIRTFAEDSSLEAEVCLVEDRVVTALELQRFYYERARAWLETRDVTPLEDREVVRLWGQVLDALEADPSTLVGRVDWVSKRYLIETAAAGERYEVQKKVDLRYHELGGGYYDLLESKGVAPRLVEPDAVTAAMRAPPEDTPAVLRSRIIKDVRHDGATVYVSWKSVRVGNKPWAKVIRLDEYRS